jgi:predicted SnoaL-like aldol condensation-catalyzing enzyme
VTVNRKDQIRALLKSIETGQTEAVAVVSTQTYIQHNPQTHDGSEGLAALFKSLSLRSPKVNIVRAFEDGEFVFGHTEYDFGSPRVGFEIFRFEDDLVVEHWDNIQPRQGPNVSGHTMVDGPTEAADLALTEANREIVRAFSDAVLVGQHLDTIAQFVDADLYIEHSPHSGDGLSALKAFLMSESGEGPVIRYDRNHRLLADGNFVLSVNEGFRDDVHSAIHDLYRLADGRIVEHWNTIEAIAPRSEWKNNNGKF